MYDVNAVAANIKNARLLRNYSQDYLAHKLNISQNAYSKVECGYTKVTIDRLKVIAKVLEVDLVKLIGPTSTYNPDVEAISQISMVPKLLEIVCRATGMGFAAIARVTDDRWIACSVRDEISFGLIPGGELRLETTICHEIRQSGRAVVIDEVAKDSEFATHHTPAMYGFQSYISVPIILPDGTFWGTLCAIDPKPAKVNNTEITSLFKSLSELIALNLETIINLTLK